MEHLTSESLEALRRGEPAAVGYFREHLSRPCDACEEFLMGDGSLPLLEGRVDEVLLALAPGAADDAGFGRLVRRLRRPARWRPAIAAASALAAAVLLVLLPRLGSFRPGSQEEGVKGAPVLQLELFAVERAPDGSLRRVDPGSGVDPGSTLLFRYRASAPAVAFLMLQREGGKPEVLGRFQLQPGVGDLATPAGLAGVSLSGEQGPITFWLVAGRPELSASPAASFSIRVQSSQNSH